MAGRQLGSLVGGEPADVGRALVEYRRRHDLTLQDVSALTGVSVGTLSKIENEKATPSFRTLTRLIQVLGLPHPDHGDETPSGASARKTVTRLDDAIINVTDISVMEIHAAELLNKAMFPMVARILVHEEPPIEEWTRHEGDEFIYVLSGEVEIFVEHYSSFVLKAGESTYYDSGMRHTIVSRSRKDAVVLSVSTSRPHAGVVDLPRK